MCTNLINEKKYIGQTTRGFEKRIAEHVNCNKQNENVIFHKAIKKYGWENFESKVIDSVDYQNGKSVEELREELDKKEQYWILHFNTYIDWENSRGYNMTTGGFSNQMCAEVRSKLSKSTKGKRRGKNSPVAKLTEGQVEEIK